MVISPIQHTHLVTHIVNEKTIPPHIEAHADITMFLLRLLNGVSGTL